MPDDPNHSKSTRTFDRGQLAELTAAARGETTGGATEAPSEAPVEDPFSDLAVGSEPTAMPALPVVGRSETISDPLTMALLAEVARNSQTVELDPERIAEAEQTDVPHPHVKRRG